METVVKAAQAATVVAVVLGTLAALSALGRGTSSTLAATTAAPQLNLTGTWNGSGSNAQGPGTFTWDLTQINTSISGTAVVASNVTGTCASCHKNKRGTISGTLSGSSDLC